MSDDSTHDNWEPSAGKPDQPPEPGADQPPSTPPTWAPPTYGAPPANWAAPGAPYGSAPYSSAPYGSAPYSSAPYGSPYGPAGSTDYLQSPPPPRRHRVLIGVIVVVLVVAAGTTATVLGVGSGKTKTSAASSSPMPSASAVIPPGPAPSSQPAPSGGARPQASSGPLDNYLVAPGDLGSHTLMVLIDGGRDVTDEATLDFCGYHYTSESLRSTRVQVEYIGGTQDASNEFVQYKPGGAPSAYAEIQKAVNRCPSTYTDENENSQMSQLQHLSNVAGLVQEHVAIEFAVTTTSFGGNPVNEWSTVVYQFDGDYFSGIYVYGTDKARVEQVGEQLAAKAAQHLIEAATGKPGSGGGTFTDPNAQLGPGAQA